MNDIRNNKTATGEWNGVTLDELKFMRAASLIRLEMQKEYLTRKAIETLPIKQDKNGGFIGGLTDKLTFVQKTILFIKGIKLATSIISFFKKSKNRKN